MDRIRKLDDWLIVSTLVLAGIGVIAVYSASAVVMGTTAGDEFFYFSRQLSTFIVGAFVMYIFSCINYQNYRPLVYPMLFGTLIMLILVLLPFIGHLAGNARRWIEIGSFRFQPAEIAKLSLILYLAYSLEKKDEDKIKTFTYGFIPHLIVTGVMAALVLKQPDFGTTMTLITILVFLLFIAGAKIGYLLLMGFIAFLGAAAIVLMSPTKMKRIMVFLDPYADRLGSGYQVYESLITVGSGGLLGAGPGGGKQKLFFLPEAHTDFIFAIIAEELGYIGVIVLLLLFVIIIWRGIKIAHTAPDNFGRYLAFGITFSFGLQALVNIAMSMGMLPTKGLTLPLISYGRTSMIITFASLGILANIGMGGNNVIEKKRIEASKRPITAKRLVATSERRRRQKMLW